MKKFLILALDDFTTPQVFSWPMKHLGAAVEVYGGKQPNAAVARAMDRHQPDVVVWSAVCGGESMPDLSVLRALRARCRSTMICWDAAHPDWHPYLADYAKHETFDLIAAVDGSDTPWCESFLCPINPEWYDGIIGKSTDLGFMGSYDVDSSRGRVLAELGSLVTVKRRTGEPGKYGDYADFMLRCRASINVAGCAGDQGQHVKARCVEAAWAGCMLFESAGSPLSKFIDPKCFYQYAGVADIQRVVQGGWFKEMARDWGNKLREAMQPHHPRHFWERVLGN